MKTIYISGPMSGIEFHNYPAFHAAAKHLRAQGYTVINPAEIEPDEQTWEAFMRADIKALMDADAVAVLPGWEQSRGAKIEVELARQLGMEIYEYGTMMLISA